MHQIFHKPTRTIQTVALIDFVNGYVDTFGIDQPICGIPFDNVEWRMLTGFIDKNGEVVRYRDIYFDESLRMKGVVNHLILACWTLADNKMNDPMRHISIIGNIDLNPGLIENPYEK